MQDILAFLRQIELSPHVQTVIGFLESADPVFIGLVVGVFVCLGYKMAGNNKPLKSWGLRIGLSAFLLHAGFAIYEMGGVEHREFAGIALRAGIVAGAVLAVIWIVLPVLIFIYSHLRLALAAFILYFGYSVINIGEWPADELQQIAVKSAMAAALVVTVAWIFQPVLDAFAAKCLPTPAAHKEPPRSKKDRRERQLQKLRRRYEELLATKNRTTVHYCIA